MTDKQIIYNDVDVSKCIDILNDRAEEGYTAVCRSNNGSCKDNPNCYYKNWQRAEQKLAKIKEILEIHKDNKCAICPKFDECFEQPSCDNVILQIIEGKENE